MIKFNRVNTISDFLLKCSTTSGSERLAEIIEFCQFIIDPNEDKLKLENFLFPNTIEKDERDNRFKKLALLLHPDKNLTLPEEQKKLLMNAFFIISEIKCCIEIEERRLADKKRYESSSINLANIIFFDSTTSYFGNIKALEENILKILKVYGLELSELTHRSLIHLYSRVLQYLIYWSIESNEPIDKEWLINNMSLLADHCFLLTNDIKRAGAEKVFESALQISLRFDCTETDVSNLADRIFEEKQRREAAAKTATKAAAVGMVSGTAISLLFGPFGWLGIATTLTMGIGQLYVTDRIEKEKDKSRIEYYRTAFQDIIHDAERVLKAVTQEIKYRQTYREMQKNTERLSNSLERWLLKKRESLLAKADKTEEEEILLKNLNQFLQNIERRRNRFFTVAEQQQLMPLGIRVDGVRTSEEAMRIREDFLNASLPPEVRTLLSTLRRSRTALGTEARLMLTDYPAVIEKVYEYNDEYFTEKEVEPDGNCGYTAFGIDRKQALRLINENLDVVSKILKLVVEEQLLNENFISYFLEEPLAFQDLPILLAAFAAYQEAAEKGGEMQNAIISNLKTFATNPVVMQAYINYDIRDGRIDAGWSHPGVLQALAHIQGIDLYIWQLDSSGKLMPHQQPQYRHYISPNAEHPQRTDLLFLNGNHFNRLEKHPSTQPSQNLGSVPTNHPSISQTSSRDLSSAAPAGESKTRITGSPTVTFFGNKVGQSSTSIANNPQSQEQSDGKNSSPTLR